MYRNTAQIPSGNMTTTTLLTPPLDKPRDRADPELSRALAEKRRQIEDEITSFRTLKEKEFREFENELLRQKQRRKREVGKPKDGSSAMSKDKSPTALSLLGVLNQSSAHMNGSLARQKKSATEETARPPPSKPTLSLDKLNIEGETTPPLTAGGSPPSPSLSLKRQISRSPPNQSFAFTPPRSRLTKPEQAQLTPPTPSTDHGSENFVGIFSPVYLPLLEARDNIQIRKPARSGSFSMTRSSSASASISPVSRKDRALTAPLLPSNSLPSALRTASGTAMRKRKHVTFQLADSAIVEPSSSYEEGPSPMREDELDFDEKIDDMVVSEQEHPEEAEEESKSAFAKKEIRSPIFTPKERKSSQDGDLLSPKSTLEISAEDNGIGFFELDEELASPGFRSHDAKFIDDDMEDVETSAELRREDGDDENLDNEGGWDVRKPTYEYGGSVPINIVRPSGSWVGSFGH